MNPARSLLLAISPAVLLCGAAAFATAAPSGKPSIIITFPRHGAVIYGSTVTARVAVSSFELVKPVLKNPRPLKGNVGHIHYVLDSMANFKASRDASMSLSHTWTHVTPGRHTIIAYLATNLNLPFPRAEPAEVTITVQPAAPRPTPHPRRRVRGPTPPGVGRAPTTGGGAGGPGSVSLPISNVNFILAALLVIILGMLLLGRRYALAAMGFESRGSGDIGSRPIEPLAIRDGELVGTEAAPITEAHIDGESRLELGAQSSPPSEGLSPPDPASDPVSPAPEHSAIPPQPTEGGSSSVPTDGEPMPDAASSRARAMEMAQQWSDVIQDLVRQLEAQESERRQLMDQIAALEQRLQEQETLRQALTNASMQDPISGEDVQVAQYVTEQLIRDPDHLVVLASVAQNAQRLARIVNRYAGIHRALGGR